MSALSSALAVCVLSVCLFHALPGAAAGNLPRTAAAEGCGEKLRADMMFLLDASGSIYHVYFEKIKGFVRHIVNSFTIGSMGFNIAVSTFGDSVKNEFWLNSHTTKSSLLDAINEIEQSGGTSRTDLALKHARQEAFTVAHGDRGDATNILIVVTDGMSDNATLTADEANKLHKTDIKVIAVGVGQRGQDELNAIASDDESIFYVTNFRALNSIEELVKNTVCEVIAAAPSGSRRVSAISAARPYVSRDNEE